MLTTNTGHRSRQNAILTVKMRINAPNESGKGGSGRKVFSFLFPILNFFHFCVRLRFYNRRPQTHINTGEKEKRPEMSEHKWFRSLRAFHMCLTYQTVPIGGITYQKVRYLIEHTSDWPISPRLFDY